MNWDRVEGDWKQIKGKVQQQWGKLTNDDLDVDRGQQDRIAGRHPEALRLRQGRGRTADRHLDEDASTNRTAQLDEKPRGQPTARLLLLCALRSKNSAWLITADTIAG